METTIPWNISLQSPSKIQLEPCSLEMSPQHEVIPPKGGDAEQSSVLKKNYTTLVLSSGGTRGLSQIGALHSLYTNKSLNNINTYIGTSVGAMIAYLLCIGYTPVEIFSKACITEFDKLMNFHSLNLIDITREFGIISFDSLNDELEKLSIDKIGYVPTMSELYELTNKELYMTTYNLTTHATEYLSYKTHEDLSCLDAIHMSCNIAIVFHKKIYNNNFYVDGAFSDKFPILFATKLDTSTERGNILGINIETADTLFTKLAEDTDFVTYLRQVLSISYHTNKSLTEGFKSENVDIITIHTKTSGITSGLITTIDRAKKYELFNEGFDQVQYSIDQLKEDYPPRPPISGKLKLC